MKRTVLVSGTLAFDTLETPYGKRAKVLGGTANYFSLAASVFTTLEVSSIVGFDFPKEHLNFLEKRGVAVSNVEYSKNKTFHWVGKYVGTMNEAETIDTELNALLEYNPKINDLAKKCEIVFLANIDPSKQSQIIKGAVGAKLVICDTMNYWIKSKLEELKEVFKHTNILIINEHEARMLTNEINIVPAVKKLVKMGPKTVVIKRGEYGSFVYREGEHIFYVPAYPLHNVVDPTGAGDTFAGGFTGYLATSKDYNSFSEIKKAMIYGSVTASFTVEGFGIERIAKATIEEIQSRYKDMVEMLSL